MSTNKQRRESERQRLQRQLEERRKRELARRRNTTIASVVGALVVIAAVVVVVVVASSGGGNKTASKKTSSTPASTTQTSAAADSEPVAPKLATACAEPGGSTVHLAGLTVTGATTLTAEPKLTGKATSKVTDDVCQDLVVGKGAAVTSSSVVTIQYVGALAATGKIFQASWTAGGASQNSATGFVPGFSAALVGGNKVTPMHAGGRRLVIMPASSAYPTGSAQAGIPSGADLVFIIDVTKVSAG